MKSQKQNEGDLKELNVMIEEKVMEDFEKMSSNTNISVADLVVTAMKRFRSSHSDYLKTTPKSE